MIVVSESEGKSVRVPWLGAPPQRGRERRGSRAGRTEPPCGAGGLGDREEGLDRGVVADLPLLAPAFVGGYEDTDGKIVFPRTTRRVATMPLLAIPIPEGYQPILRTTPTLGTKNEAFEKLQCKTKGVRTFGSTAAEIVCREATLKYTK